MVEVDGGEMSDPAKWALAAVFLAAGIIAAVSMMNQEKEKNLTADEQKMLLEMARTRLRESVNGEQVAKVDEADVPASLKREAACFVTLTKKGALRGCILDSFDAHEPMYKNVLRNVVLAATSDPRFPRVSPSEIDDIKIEISVLDRPRPLEFSSPEELVSKLVPGRDGVILKTSWGSSTYLPQVWDDLPDPVQFLSSLCQKQGGSANCWRDDPLLKVEIYHVLNFSE
jgi:AmmeMemoRadiSam system protein A